MKKRNRFSKNEDIVILECVREHTNNLAMAFRIANLVLPKRTLGVITNRWYKTISKKIELYTVDSSIVHMSNRKCMREENKNFCTFVKKTKGRPKKQK